MVVSDNPDTNPSLLDIVKEMVGESFQVAAPQPIRVKMEEARIRTGLFDPNLELREKVVPERFRNF